MPTYKVDRPGSNAPRVVEAKTPAAARAHVAKDELKVSKIATAEAFKLAATGVTLETAGEEAAEPEPESEELDPDRLRDDKIERDRLAAEDDDNAG